MYYIHTIRELVFNDIPEDIKAKVIPIRQLNFGDNRFQPHIEEYFWDLTKPNASYITDFYMPSFDNYPYGNIPKSFVAYDFITKNYLSSFVEFPWGFHSS